MQQFRFLVLKQDPKALQSLQEKFLLTAYQFELLEDPYALLGRLREGSFFGLIMPLALPTISGLDLVHLLRGDPRLSSLWIGLIHKAEDKAALDKKSLELEHTFWLQAPLNPEELALHLEGLATAPPPYTRVSSPLSTLLKLGEIEMDLERYEFKLKNKLIPLTPIEFKLLKLFIERKGRIQTREHLLATIWGYTTEVESRTIDTHIRRLREKLQEEAKRIQTVRGVGYKLLEDN